MSQHKKVDVSPKGRRLVERALQLNVKKATTYFLPDNGDWTKAKKSRDSLHRSARLSKQVLLEYIEKLEKQGEAARTELRRLRMAMNL